MYLADSSRNFNNILFTSFQQIAVKQIITHIQRLKNKNKQMHFTHCVFSVQIYTYFTSKI